MKVLSVVALGFAAACGNGGDDGPVLKGDHPRIYISANKDRLAAALAAQTPAAKRFLDITDRWVGGENVYGFDSWNAALVGRLTGDAKYCTAAIADVDGRVSAATSAIAGGGQPDVAHDDYLDIGEEIGNLAIVYDWCNTQMTAGQQKAWLAYGQQAVFNIWNPDQATWGGQPAVWAGWAIHDPLDNYYYSFLRATMLFGLAAHDDLPAANQWIAQFHDTKLMGELIPLFDRELGGGGSLEGTGYGVSLRSLWELYDWWKASTGEDLATKSAQTRASMVDFMHTVVPTLDRIAAIGDQSRDSTAAFFDYHRQYLAELVTSFPDDPQAPRAAQLLASSSVPQMSQPFMYVYDFLYDNSDVTPAPLDGFGTAYYAPGTGQLFARSGWDPHATWLNVTAGAYTESHAHQDQGALTIYKDGWLAFDAVVVSQSGLTQDTTSHGVVRIVDKDGTTVEQKVGSTSTVAALHTGPGWLHFAADLSPAYEGTTATRVQREVVYLQPDCIVVYDRVTTGSDATAIWQLAMPNAVTVTPTGATMDASGHTLHIQRVAGDSVAASVHRYADDSDFSGGFRYDEQLAGGERHLLHVIWVDGAVGTVVAQGAAGAAITFGDGSTAAVTFDPESVNGTLSIKPLDRANVDATLVPGVDALPETAP